jgi:hypothetical protein
VIEALLDKTADVDNWAERAIADNALISGMVDGLTEKNEDYRYNCSKVLHVIARTNAMLIYPYWDKLVDMMESKNSFHRMSAVNHLAGLAEVDTENKFENIFDAYYALLDDPSVIVAIYVAQASGKIAAAKSDLAVNITNRLLDIDKTHHLPSRKALIKAGIIESFDNYISRYPGKAAMLDFVKKQIESDSPKTRNLAKAFLKKWPKKK